MIRPAFSGAQMPAEQFPEKVLDACTLVRHKPQRKYGRRSYWAKCQRIAIEFPIGVSPDSKWLKDCPQCFPEE